MGVRELKHGAKLQEWSARITECRSSGKRVKEWCAAQGINAKTYYYWEKQFVTEASQQLALPKPEQSATLMRVNPDILSDAGTEIIASGITIRHGESFITLPGGSSVETIANLVKALNRYA